MNTKCFKNDDCFLSECEMDERGTLARQEPANRQPLMALKLMTRRRPRFQIDKPSGAMVWEEDGGSAFAFKFIPSGRQSALICGTVQESSSRIFRFNNRETFYVATEAAP